MIVRAVVAGLCGVLLASAGNAQSVASPPQWQYYDRDDGCSASWLTDREFAFLAIRADGNLVVRAHAKDWRLGGKRAIVAAVHSQLGFLRLDATTAETANEWSGFVGTTSESAIDGFAADPLTVRLEPEPNAMMTLTGLPAVAAHLKACATRLTRVTAEKAAASAPKLIAFGPAPGDFAGVVRPGGALEYRLIVGIDGRPRSCKVLKTSGESLFDERACMAMLRGMRFVPARNAAGKPVEGKYQSRIKL